MSNKDGNQIHVESEAATGGSKENVVRWVLGISLLAAIVLLSAIWIFGAASQGETEEEITATGAMLDNSETTGDDGVLIEGADEFGDAGGEFENGLEVIENDQQ